MSVVYWGGWSFLGFVLAILPSLAVLWYAWPRKAITNFYIDSHLGGIGSSPGPLRPVVEFRMKNHTNKPIYVLSEGFTFGAVIEGAPGGGRNAATQVYQAQFEGREPGNLSEIDTLVRPNQEITTWVPVNPQHTPTEIEEALKRHEVGTLHLKCRLLGDRPFREVTLNVPA